MKSVEKLFLGILLAALGVFIIYQSFYYHLIEIFMIFGVILLIIGLYFLVLVFLDNYKDTKPKGIKSNDSTPDYKTFSNATFNKNSKITKKGGKKIADKVKKVPNSKTPNELLKKPASKAKTTDKNLNFTPNYERPVKVSRKPLKKSDLIDVSNAPDISKIPKVNKSKEIFEALASDDFIVPEHNIEDSDDFIKSENNVENDKTLNTESQKSEKPNFNLTDSSNNSEIYNELDKVAVNSEEDSVALSSKEDSVAINSEKDNVAENSENTVLFDDLKSCVLTPDGVTSSKQAFEQMVNNAKDEILLETSSIKDIVKDFSSVFSGLNVKIIIQELDIKDMSIMFFVNSLLKQGVHIRVLPFINTTNLIVDEKNALIVSKNEVENEVEVGAVYNKIKDVLEVKDTFEKSWELATDFDLDISSSK